MLLNSFFYLYRNCKLNGVLTLLSLSNFNVFNNISVFCFLYRRIKIGIKFYEFIKCFFTNIIMPNVIGNIIFDRC